MRLRDVPLIVVAGAFCSLPVVALTGSWWPMPLMVLSGLIGPKMFEVGDRLVLASRDRWFGWRLRRDMDRKP